MAESRVAVREQAVLEHDRGNVTKPSDSLLAHFSFKNKNKTFCTPSPASLNHSSVGEITV